MKYAYFLDVIETEDNRNNSQVFQLINEFNLPDHQIFDDEESERPEFAKLFDILDEGDTLIIRSVLDITDDVNELHGNILPSLAERGVELFSCEEPYLCGTEYAENFLSMAKLIKAFIRKGKKARYQQALDEGRVGRPAKTEEVEKAISLYKTGKYKLSQIEQLTGVSKSTLYKYLKE